MSSTGVLLSSFERETHLRWMADTQLDLLVIGGGITGAGIALDAASRGLVVGLVEKQDFAEGTSSRSTKLIHGGLRYLKQFEIGLVREVGRERAILHRNAPHLVSAERMLLPIIDGGTYGKLATSAGLWLYDRLAGVRRSERRYMLSKLQTIAAEPLLAKEKLRGGGMYYEYRTDDARLTVEVLKTASQYGARCINYAEAVEFTYDDNHKVTGAVVHDTIDNETYRVSAKKVINATGPWVDQLREKDGSRQGKRLHLTKGVHIVVPYQRAPISQSVYFDVADGRMIFAIPRGRTTYIGTTDTDYQGDLENPTVTKEDVIYLLDAFNEMFPTVHLSPRDVQSSWAGVRPLIHEEGKSSSELSRKDEIFISDSELISIAGGKLTGYRKMAERVVDLALEALVQEEGYTYKRCFTDTITLSGGDTLTPAQIEELHDDLRHEFGDEVMPAAQIDALVADFIGKYGSNTPMVVAEVLRCLSSGIRPEDAAVVGEFDYCMQYEMATRPSDFLIRRTGRLLFERGTIDGVSTSVWANVQPNLASAFQADRMVWTEAYASVTAFQDEIAATEGKS
jgi:glycerol-3-phosphate dehydrogenase